MKMPRGGFMPGYNIRLGVTGNGEGGPVTIVSVQVSQVGSDKGSLSILCQELGDRYEKLPGKILADADHATRDDIKKLEQEKVELIVPVGSTWKEGDSDREVRRWKERMKTEEAKREYRQRKALSEWINSRMKCNFGLERMSVRGVERVACFFLLAAVTSNLLTHGVALLGITS
jgi:Transposase DDE domain